MGIAFTLGFQIKLALLGARSFKLAYVIKINKLNFKYLLNNLNVLFVSRRFDL